MIEFPVTIPDSKCPHCGVEPDPAKSRVGYEVPGESAGSVNREGLNPWQEARAAKDPNHTFKPDSRNAGHPLAEIHSYQYNAHSCYWVMFADGSPAIGACNGKRWDEMDRKAA